MTNSNPANCPHCGNPIDDGSKRRFWSADEDATFRRMHQEGRHAKTIAEAIGRPVTSIRSRINHLKLRKDKTALTVVPQGSNEEEEGNNSSITVLPGVRIINHRMRG